MRIIQIFLFDAAIEHEPIDHVVEYIDIEHVVGVADDILQKYISGLPLHSQFLEDEPQPVNFDEVIEQVFFDHRFQLSETLFITEIGEVLFNELLVFFSQRSQHYLCTLCLLGGNLLCFFEIMILVVGWRLREDGDCLFVQVFLLQ